MAEKKQFINWDKSLIIGVKEIDEQHKKFIDIINKTHAISKKESKKEIGEIIDSLIEFARVHFSTEDNYFKKWSYPYTDEHDIEHEKLLLRVLKLKTKSEQDEEDLLQEVAEFLKDWLVNHLENHDFKYRDYFREKGLI